MVSHRGALGFVEWAADAVGLRSSDRVAAIATHFDLSIFDLFATAAAGATLVPLPEGIMLRPRELTRWIAREEISVWYSTPSTLILLLEEGDFDARDYAGLRRVLFAGEVFPTKHLRHLRRALPEPELYNLYGPTETNVCTWHPVGELPAGDRQTIPIGRACANTEVVALDDAGREAAAGGDDPVSQDPPERRRSGLFLPRRPRAVLGKMREFIETVESSEDHVFKDAMTDIALDVSQIPLLHS